MQVLDVALAFAAFLGLCVFFNRRCAVAGARTPLLTGSVIVVWLTVWGIAGALRAGGWLLYIGAAALGVWSFVPARRFRFHRLRGADGPTVTVIRVPERPAPPPLLDFGFVLFAALTGVNILVYAIRQPLFSAWDEMSFWGTACKLVSLNDELYTTAAVGWDWVGAQQPGAILSAYFFQFFGSFAPWKCFVGYNALMFAAFAAVLGALAGQDEARSASWRRWPLGLAVGVLCVLTPYLCTVYSKYNGVVPTYMSSYGDIPAGVLAGGAAAWYFGARSSQRLPSVFGGGSGQGVCTRELCWLPAVLAGCGLIKENIFPIVLVAAGLAAADTLVWGAPALTDGPAAGRSHGSLWRRGAFAAAVLAAPASVYFAWSSHIAAVVSQRVSSGETGSTSMSLVQVVLLGFRQLLVPAERTERFIQVTSDMLEGLVSWRITAFGSVSSAVLGRLFGRESAIARLPGTGVWVIGTLLALFLLAALLQPDKGQRRRTLLAAGLSTAGFVGYYWVLILSYSFIFKALQADGLADYNRYVYPYYIFWFLLALSHLAASARRQGGRRLLTGGLLAAAALALAVINWYVPPRGSALEWPQDAFDEQHRFADSAAALTQQVEAEGLAGSIFFVSTDDNGYKYFNYSHHLLPVQLDYSFGGGPLSSDEVIVGWAYYHLLTYGELESYLVRKSCDYIFLETFDELFENSYKDLFTDGLAAAHDGCRLYVRVQAAPRLQYAPAAEQSGGGEQP